MKIGANTDKVAAFRPLVRDQTPHIIFADELGNIVASNQQREKISEDKKMPKGKLSSVYMVKDKTVVGEAVRGRCNPIEYGLLGDMEAESRDLWWLEDYFFFTDWAEDHYGQVSSHSSMSQAGAMEQDCPSSSTTVDSKDECAPRTSKRRKL